MLNWSLIAIKYFDQRVIYCMSHVPQILYTALLRDDGLKVFLRYLMLHPGTMLIYSKVDIGLGPRMVC